MLLNNTMKMYLMPGLAKGCFKFHSGSCCQKYSKFEYHKIAAIFSSA